jgi:large subunit ribosomal protein L21
LFQFRIHRSQNSNIRGKVVIPRWFVLESEFWQRAQALKCARGLPIEVHFQMHAIIETGGKQFRVAPGDVIRVPKLAGEVGAEVALGKVVALFRDSGDLLLGEQAGGVTVNATVAAQDRGEKILVFKFKRKKQYKRTQGHRQDYTEVRIRDIVA